MVESTTPGDPGANTDSTCSGRLASKVAGGRRSEERVDHLMAHDPSQRGTSFPDVMPLPNTPERPTFGYRPADPDAPPVVSMVIAPTLYGAV